MDAPGIGHNSIAADRLKTFCERIERLKEEVAGLHDDIKDIKAEAKGAGFDLKTLNEMLRLRAMDSDKRQEQEDLRDLYASVLGLW